MKKFRIPILILIWLPLIFGFSPLIVFAWVLLIFGVPFYFIYSFWYFRCSKSFAEIKNNIQDLIRSVNDFNNHVEDLKNAYVYTNAIDYGVAEYYDASRYNFKRPELKKLRETPNTHYCSLQVCHNAGQRPYEYICKYFDLEKDEKTLEQFEKILNDFSAAEQGQLLLKAQRDEIVAGISSAIPFLIKKLSAKRLMKELGFAAIDFSHDYFLQYNFLYVSAGGNSSRESRITLDIDNLNGFVHYLSEKIKFRQSVAGQRALMTTHLREKIKLRDKHTCKMCGVSVYDEPNLLLEIDHIVPLSKGGMSTEENLQTLCWRCNRSKGAKILDYEDGYRSMAA